MNRFPSLDLVPVVHAACGWFRAAHALAGVWPLACANVLRALDAFFFWRRVTLFPAPLQVVLSTAQGTVPARSRDTLFIQITAGNRTFLLRRPDLLWRAGEVIPSSSPCCLRAASCRSRASRRLALVCVRKASTLRCFGYMLRQGWCRRTEGHRWRTCCVPRCLEPLTRIGSHRSCCLRAAPSRSRANRRPAVGVCQGASSP